jgi:ABC-type transport system involved in Fe-S cluster assembly fused permease/ATPase subunit
MRHAYAAERISKTISPMVIYILPLFFEIQAFVVLWSNNGWTNALLWASQVVTVALIAYSVWYILMSSGRVTVKSAPWLEVK